MPRSVLVWALALIIAGSIAVAICVASAPPVAADAPRDFMDSPYLLLSFVGLAILAGLAGWFVPQTGFLWGLIAAAPFYVYFAVGVIEELREGGQGLWPVGLLFLVGLTLIPVVSALTTSLVARAR
ncbi:hypothetical protein [Microtetraspora sp. NBRC 16547]|uniref:hypothetical protein n=1 Tax=Microtetraspora sp. NBRC 16547 TaxID=3030993 RepID=UPI0024A08213|nr:hypothetical protein [Microtetraspora sp. NBRC 16547]GLX00528.1 hypothetical protein Misp02_46140 [Microtetraspora sp. NBRC 16547]